jgi:lipopolysaccharide export system protein LptA
MSRHDMNVRDKIGGLNSISYKLKFGMILIVIALLLTAMVTTALATAEMQVFLDADDGIDYDLGHNITTARKNVRLTRGDLLITADQIVYYGKTGVVEATGNVNCKTGATEFQTEFLTYNMLTNTGKSEVFSATISGEPRNFNIKGQGISLNTTNAEFSQVAITRCPKANPDYVLSAAQVKFSGRRIQLKHVVLRIKGVPVFYFPGLIFYTDYGIPLLEPGYDKDYGYKLKYQFILADTKKREWNLKGELSGKGDANFGLKMGTKWGRSHNQTELLYYYWHDSWKVSNNYSYETDLFTANIDGFKEFNDNEERQLGMTLTRKYWQSAVGEWQAGVFLRRVLADDGGGADYGGTYSGIRLDYKPIEQVKLSWLEIKSHTGNDYRDLMDDFGIGSNALYEVNIPLSSRYTAGVSGCYNLSDDQWYHEIYSITADYCCFRPTIAYDRADHSWNWTIKCKF